MQHNIFPEVLDSNKDKVLSDYVYYIFLVIRQFLKIGFEIGISPATATPLSHPLKSSIPFNRKQNRNFCIVNCKGKTE